MSSRLECLLSGALWQEEGSDALAWVGVETLFSECYHERGRETMGQIQIRF